jgi:hypothetical protein
MKDETKEGEREDQSQPPALNQTSKTKSYSLKDKLLMALIIIGVIALGLFVLNQFISWRYKALLLQTPCDICRELNPSVENCFTEIEKGINKNQFKLNLTPYS